MKKYLLILIVFFVSKTTFCQNEALIIPAPNHIEYKEGRLYKWVI